MKIKIELYIFTFMVLALLQPYSLFANDIRVTCSVNETLEMINGIAVCKNKYNAGKGPYDPNKYTCIDYANDFREEARKLGIPAWVFHFGLATNSGHELMGHPCFEHAINIVEVHYRGPLQKFCFIEPQTNARIACWIGDGLCSIPEYMKQELIEYYSKIKKCPFTQENVERYGADFEVVD